jgi:DHA1 family tetracycline resistance protein-like MFS transporter
MADAPKTDSQRLPSGLIVLLAVVFVNMVGFGVVVPLLPFFARSMNADPWQITLMFSAYSLGQFFGEPFWGRLSDRIGRKPVLLMTISSNIVGYLALAFAPNIWVAILVRLATGFGAGNISTVQGAIADVTPPHQRAARLGLTGAAFGLGFIVGPALGGLLTQEELGRLGFQIPLFVGSFLAALSALGVSMFVTESRERATTPDRTPRWGAFRAARAHPVISRVLVVSLIYMAAFSGMESTFALWAQARWDWGAREVGLAFMGVGVVSTIGQGFLTGRLVRRFGEPRVLATGMSVFGASLLLQTLAPLAALVPVIMAFGAFGMSLAMPCISSIISRSSPPDQQGAMLGLNMAAGSSARIFGPILAGVAFSALGPDWPFWAGAALTVPAVVMAANAGRAIRRFEAVAA